MPGAVSVIELVNGVEGLELTACAPVELGKGDYPVDLRDAGLGAAVPVCAAGPEFFLTVQKHIVYGPGIHRQALNRRELPERRRNPLRNALKHGFHIPDQTAIRFLCAVGKAVHLLGPQLSILLPAHNVPPGGRADVNC